MSIKRTVIIILLLIFGSVLTCGYLLQRERQKFEMTIASLGDSTNSPECLQMYNLIEKKSKEYKIPKYILSYLTVFHLIYNFLKLPIKILFL